MTFFKKIVPIFLFLTLVLTGCGKSSEQNKTTPETAVSDTSFEKTDTDMFTDRDLDDSFDEETAVKITLNGENATADDSSVEITDSTIKITKEATYIVSGNLQNGQIIVEADEKAKLQIVLDSAQITSETSAPIYIKTADKVFITLSKDSENTLTNGGSFEADGDINIDGTVFSKQDLTFNGEGSLTVTSPSAHGIVCKDDLVFTNGCYTINSASHALDANDSIRSINATITADSGKDAFHAENSDDETLGFIYISSGNYGLEAEGDGISAGNTLQINDGEFSILAGGGSENGDKQNSGDYGGFMGGGHKGPGGDMPGGRGGMGMRGTSFTDTATTTNTTDSESTSMKGIKSVSSALIKGGTFTINSADDSLHSDSSLYIIGGDMDIDCGDDGLHAEEILEITGGRFTINESYEGIEALHIKISGGDITLTADDDGLNAAGGTDQSGFNGRDNGDFSRKGGGHGMMSQGNGSIVISGGSIDITASGDGIDANGTVNITGGKTTVCGPTSGDTATLDYDTSCTIEGGTFIGTGASGMAQTFSDSTQGVIAVSVRNCSANTEITVKNSSGKTVISHTPPLDFAVVIISSPDIEKGESYTLSIGGEEADMTAN